MCVPPVDAPANSRPTFTRVVRVQTFVQISSMQHFRQFKDESSPLPPGGGVLGIKCYQGCSAARSDLCRGLSFKSGVFYGEMFTTFDPFIEVNITKYTI